MVRTHISSNYHRPPSSQIDLFRCARSQSGFRGVYLHKKNAAGVDVWHARVKHRGQLKTLPGSRSTEPWRCVTHLVRWYAERFGANWPDALAARKANPFLVRRSAKYGGFVCAVWLFGSRCEVTTLRRIKGKGDRWRPTDELAVFPTAAAARAGLVRYLRLRYGVLADWVVWRTQKHEGQAFAHPSRAA